MNATRGANRDLAAQCWDDYCSYMSTGNVSCASKNGLREPKGSCQERDDSVAMEQEHIGFVSFQMRAASIRYTSAEMTDLPAKLFQILNLQSQANAIREAQ